MFAEYVQSSFSTTSSCTQRTGVWQKILWELHQQNKQLILSLPIEGPMQFKTIMFLFYLGEHVFR